MKERLIEFKHRLLDSARIGNVASLQAVVEESNAENGEREELINAVDEDGWTALHFVSFNGHPKIIRWLLSDSGGRAAGFRNILSISESEVTALHLACRYGYLECVQALVEGSKVDNGEREALLNAANENGWTALHYAVHNGRALIVRWLLSDSGGRAAGFKSSTITAKTVDSESALHFTSQYRSPNTLRALLSGCTSAERMNLFLCVDVHGWTAFHVVVRSHQPEIIRELLLHHPETQMIVDHRDRRGMTALHRAVIGGLDDESRREWRTYFYGMLSREETVEALLTTPSSTTTIPTNQQQAGAQIDPNVGLKFD